MPGACRSDAAGLPVRPGEEPWIAAELADVRAELESEAAARHADIARSAAEAAERLTVELARRADGNPQNADQLPKIEGKANGT